MAAYSGAVVLITLQMIILLLHTYILPCEGDSYTPLKVDIPDDDSIRIFTDEDLKKYDDSNVSFQRALQGCGHPSKSKQYTSLSDTDT